MNGRAVTFLLALLVVFVAALAAYRYGVLSAPVATAIGLIAAVVAVVVLVRVLVGTL